MSAVDVDKLFGEFEKDLAELIERYRMDISVGFEAEEIAAFIVGTLAALQPLSK